MIFATVDFLYFGANLLKVPDGGWFPLLIGAVAFTLLTTWARGRKLMIDRMNEASLADRGVHQVGFDQRYPRQRHGGVHDQLRQWRTACAVA